MKSLICLMLMGSAITLFAEDIEKEEEAEQKEAAAWHALFITLEKAASDSATGIFYTGKGMFYVVYEAVKVGLKVTKAIVIGIPETMLKVAFFISGGYMVFAAWSLARFLGLRKIMLHDFQQAKNSCSSLPVKKDLV